MNKTSLCPLVSLAILAAFTTVGCGARSGDRVTRDVSVVREERTPDKLVARGMAFASVGDLTRAEQYLAAAIDAGADADAVLPKLLRVCVSAGHQRAAIDYAAPMLERHPGDFHLRFVVAELRASTGDFAGAREDLAGVVRAAPSEAAPHYAYARLLRDQVGDVVAADTEFREYLRVSPDGTHAEESRAALLRSIEATPRAAVPGVAQ